ncbi:unnamed protein product, partial [Brassica oleracea]
EEKKNKELVLLFRLVKVFLTLCFSWIFRKLFSGCYNYGIVLGR